jgi:hypothetical protein
LRLNTNQPSPEALNQIISKRRHLPAHILWTQTPPEHIRNGS